MMISVPGQPHRGAFRRWSLRLAPALALFLFACDESFRSPRMSVRSLEPADGTTDVSPQSSIRVTFSYRVREDSLDANTFVVQTGTTRLAGTYSYDDENRRVTFRPAADFPAGATIRVSLTSGLRSIAGTPLDARQFSFTIREADDPADDGADDGNDPPSSDDPDDPDNPDPGDDPDNPDDPGAVPPLTFTPVTPRAYATSVAPGQTIEIEFSAFVNPFTVKEETITVRGALSGPIPVAVEGILETGRTLRLVPQRVFAPGERVTVSLLKGISGADGAAFSGGAFSFRIAATAPLDEFIEGRTITTGGPIASLLAADLDGDGRPEIVYHTESDARVEILTPADGGGFEPALSLDAEQPVFAVALDDRDLDGDIDLLVGCSDHVRTYLNTTAAAGAAITFTRANSVVTRSTVRSIVLADLDHASSHDLIIDTDEGLRVFLNETEDVAAFEFGSSRVAGSPVLAEDLDGDGHLDLVYGNLDANRITLFTAAPEADGSFQAPVLFEVAGRVHHLAVDDFNGDLLPDLLALIRQPDMGGDTEILLVPQDSQGGFSSGSGVTSRLAIQATHFTFGDLNGDGVPSLVIAAADDGKVYQIAANNLGDDAAANLHEVLAAPSPSVLLPVDLTDDGILDLAIGAGNELRLALSLPAPPPPPPAELRFSVDSLSVRQGDAGVSTLVRLTNSEPVDALTVVLGYDVFVVADPAVTLDATATAEAEFVSWQQHAAEAAVSYNAIMEFLPPFEERAVAAGADQEIMRLVFDVLGDAPVGNTFFTLPTSLTDPPLSNSVVIRGESFVPELVAGVLTVEEGSPTGNGNPNLVAVETRAAAPGDRVRLAVLSSTEIDIEAFTIVATHDASVLQLIDLDLSGSLSETLNPEMVIPTIREAENFFAFSVIFDFLPPFDGRAIPAGEDRVLFHAEFEVAAGAAEGVQPVELKDGFGDPPLANLFVLDGLSYFPRLSPGAVVVEAPAAGPLFRRGDVNNDRKVELSDPIAVTNWLNRPDAFPIACLDAADVNDDGVVDLRDTTFLLDFIFYVGAPPPSPPYPGPGVDPTPDDLGCDEPAA